jgi:hypothetical protein
MALTTCQSCGAAMQDTEAYCPKCSAPRVQAGQKASGVGLWVVSGIIVVALLGVVYRFSMDMLGR